MVELPAVGTTVKMDEVFGTVDSVKATSDLFAPIDGEIVEVNGKLEEAPELVNNDPYGEGWLLAIKPADSKQYEGLMSAEAYKQLIEK